ncbi:MAG: hypothetical protein A2162_11905 [Deltaproteobacteria bacterium RBG_13_52_11b]|nr:MAG: hypothetical protein A2162_11905 [Deltaproteobacteria bacterium RBG_13_52_11b]
MVFDEVMKRYFRWFLVIFLSLTIGYHIVTMWRGLVLSQKGASKETLLRAIGVDPDNPTPFHELGLLYQWSLLQGDLIESDRYFRKAIEKNPFEQGYWLDLAKVFKTRGEGQDFERALDNAIRIFPTGYRGRWIAGNLLLQQGALEKALPHFSYILVHYPNQSTLVYDVCGKVLDDPDAILENLVPKDPSALKQYLSYLYEAGDKDAAQKAWEKKATFGFKPDPGETLRHIDFLISKGDLNEAFRLWKVRLHEEGAGASSDGRLITNGSFETEKNAGGGFDWKIGNAIGAEVSFDDSVSFEGKRSLKITFNGKENVDFQQIGQIVALKPNTAYCLKANMKTKGVTTRSGVKIEISGIGEAFYGASESLTGDNEWKELTVTFKTEARSQGGQVRVRREKTDKFDRLISGEVWVDNVQLREGLSRQ